MPHFIKPIISGSGLYASVEAFFSCTEPEDAVCRTWCKTGCESHPLIDDDGNEVECELSSLGYCYQIHDLEGDSKIWQELHDGRGHEQSVLREGEIELVFVGDGYNWRYVDNSYEWGYTNYELFRMNPPVVNIANSRSEAEEFVNNDVDEKDFNRKFFLVGRERAGGWTMKTPKN